MINNSPITTSPIKNTIHQEIEAFWIEQGYTVSSFDGGLQDAYHAWAVKIDSKIGLYIAIEMPSGEKKYRLGCFWYSEAEMLRMIESMAIMTPDIHPEIEAFWIEQGYTISPIKMTYGTYLDAHKDGKARKQIAFLRSDNVIFYYWHTSGSPWDQLLPLSEAELLRLIRLKAFL